VGESRQLQHEMFSDMPASWHKAIDAGHDMALVYEAMQRSFDERLEDLARAQAMLRAVRGEVERDDAGHTGAA